ncbi:hypothetical protein NAEGRDRAFT_58293 [Naegleria gruberi]|uniref:DUF1731 domain-containing protein n=1 Tax=Naegleria gruberi TaxID=5762 RepID=D2VI83_NAEGR|nr:uncharacterized protein NAEGRDRAFT_58293 [Naegleria gruberi]EFC43552.1 hypothetical protein NAEGRDRAFT_58293 [Naegleria gruberi]|eukprot:XP_002676296.1 hypothetical protein NAEGRDRAFT_58293 [Naegleria gruberi strain NEG-M]
MFIANKKVHGCKLGAKWMILTKGQQKQTYHHYYSYFNMVNQGTEASMQNAASAPIAETVSHLVVGGGSGFLGKQLLKQVITPTDKVPYSEKLMNISQVTVISRNPEETRKLLEKELPQSKWERKNSIQISVKNWKENESTFLFNHQVCEEKDTFGNDKKVAAINLSGVSIGKQSWTPKFKQEILDSRTATTIDLINYLNSFGDSASTFIGTSAVGFYPCTSDPNAETPIYTEYNCPSPANNPLGEVTGAVENAICNTQADNIKQRIIMRPGAIVGKGGGVLKEMTIPYLGIAVPIVFGNGLQPFSCIHLVDAANMYIHALYTNFNNYYSQKSSEKVIIYNTVMPDMITFQQFSARLNLKTNIIPFPMIPFPYSLVSKLFGNERSQLLCEGQYVLPTRSIQENFQFQYPTLHSMIDEVTTFNPNM